MSRASSCRLAKLIDGAAAARGRAAEWQQVHLDEQATTVVHARWHARRHAERVLDVGVAEPALGTAAAVTAAEPPRERRAVDAQHRVFCHTSPRVRRCAAPPRAVAAPAAAPVAKARSVASVRGGLARAAARAAPPRATSAAAAAKIRTLKLAVAAELAAPPRPRLLDFAPPRARVQLATALLGGCRGLRDERAGGETAAAADRGGAEVAAAGCSFPEMARRALVAAPQRDEADDRRFVAPVVHEIDDLGRGRGGPSTIATRRCRRALARGGSGRRRR